MSFSQSKPKYDWSVSSQEGTDMMADVNGKRKSDNNFEGEQRAKVRKTIRGVSRQQLPTVVMAMGFAIGTTGDDIRHSFTATGNNDAEGLPPNSIKATSCQVVSVGPKVIAKLTFPNNTAAKEVVASWNGIEVDGGELLVWITDDVVSPAKTEPQSPEKNLSLSFVTNKGVNGNTPPLANGNFYCGFGSSHASTTFAPATPNTLSLFANGDSNADSKVPQPSSLFKPPATGTSIPDAKAPQTSSLFSKPSTTSGFMSQFPAAASTGSTSTSA